MTKTANRLIREKSPYLLQHAYNPVDWYPWGPEAFEKARTEDKPIFLSIGYSTCYWCHVMEREVFENESIARLMNDWVVSIKVDREERPEIDRIYMGTLMAMTGSGGWPMSMFLTPDLIPFFGATYIPPEARYGRPGFVDVLKRIREVWTSDRSQITDVAGRIHEFLKASSSPSAGTRRPGSEALDSAFQYHIRMYDRQHGGFSQAPKFPRPVSLNFLLRYHYRTGKPDALTMTLETLRAMARGGIYDHIGGGFHRYSTDDRWHVPHFEKMLYDQAQLVVSYLEAYQVTGEAFMADVVRDTLAYVQRVMTSETGGFFSAEDAESAVDPLQPDRKKEGAFYLWKAEEIDGALTPEEASLIRFVFDVREGGNVSEDPHGQFQGENVLLAAHTREEVAAEFGITAGEAGRILMTARRKLFEIREQRPKPHLDDKILVSWNGLMISAFSRASQVLEDGRYALVASRAADFILTKMFDRGTGTFFRRYRAGEAKLSAHLEDHAFFIQGLLDLYEATFDHRWLKAAVELASIMIQRFHDDSEGGFFDTAGDDPSILVRTREWQDGAEPSGNAVACLDLLRLSSMLGVEEYRKFAENSLRFFGDVIIQHPQAATQFLVALDFGLRKPKQIIVAGSLSDERTALILREVRKRFMPDAVTMVADEGEGQRYLASFVPFLGGLKTTGGLPTAYICQDFACKLPATDPDTVAAQLAEVNPPAG